MTDTPEELQRKIAELDALRPSLGDAAVDAAIGVLRAQVPASARDVRADAYVDGDNYGQNIGVNLGIAIFGHAPDNPVRERLVRYLHSLACTLDQVPLRGLERRTLQQQEAISLPKVYTLLATTGRVRIAKGKPSTLTTYLDKGQLRDDYTPDQTLPDQAIIAIEHVQGNIAGRQSAAEDAPVTLWRAQLAVEAVATRRRLVLLGDPGAGKSTFLRHLGWLVAQHTLERLSLAEQALLPAELQTLLPVVLPLPRLARLLAQANGRDTTPATVVTDALHAAMRDCEAGDLADYLGDVLYRGVALLLFDGLDEVPIDAQPGERADRATTLRAVQDFAHRHRQAHIVITCRTRAFEPLQTTLPSDWHTATLAPFTLGQMRYFVAVWYDELAVSTAIDAAQVATLKQMLVADIQRRPRLHAMAETPLLLTMMALVLYNKGELPRDRPKLYEAILDLLLGQWDRVRDGQTLADVIGWRDWTSERIRPVLDRLSYEAHRDATSADGRGRLSRMAVEWALRQHLATAGMPDDEAAKAAVRAVRYIEQRSGFLQPAADDYEFAHLTLQEHCAGRHLVRQSNPLALILDHRDDDRWREPIFLGLGTIQEGNPWLIESVLRRLIQRDEQKSTERWYRDLILAAEIGVDRDWASLLEQGLDGVTLQRDLRSGLAALLNDPAPPLPVTERMRAGFLLGDLGDPRFPVEQDAWQHELVQRTESFGAASGYWCYVRPGTYRIGGWSEQAKSANITLPGFWIARYPVTVAQYQAFIEVGGYNQPDYWTANGWQWKQHNRMQLWQWDNPRYTSANQAVTGVTWYEATAFCAWLTSELADCLPTGYAICLPSEAEWEAAAAYDAAMERRSYPWGNGPEPTPEHAIFADDQGNRLDAAAPVGVCVAGAAACGALDMVGQVWEWCSSRYKAYPQGAADRQKDFTTGDYDVPWRGGSWYNSSTSVRCAARSRNPPHNAGDVIRGFRVVFSPRV